MKKKMGQSVIVKQPALGSTPLKRLEGAHNTTNCRPTRKGHEIEVSTTATTVMKVHQPLELQISTVDILTKYWPIPDFGPPVPEGF